MTGKLLAFTGRSGSGKDHLADYLIRHHGWVRVSFSDELKARAKLIFPWMDLDYSPEHKNTPINHPQNINNLTPRDIWKMLDVLRTVDPEIFIRGVQLHVKKLLHEGKDVIITDVRKPLEYKLCRNMNAEILRIVNDGTQTEFADEDIMDSFDVNKTFWNRKYQGFGEWDHFCSSRGYIESSWINILPKLVANQVKENDQFEVHIKKPHTPEMWRTAMFAEYGEFLDEIPHLWKWWKPTQEPTNYDRAVEEFVDVIKFAIGHWLQYNITNPVEASENISCDFSVPTLEVVGLDRLNNLIGTLCRDIDDGDGYMLTIMCAIHVGCELLGITKDDFLLMYVSKFEINSKRVNSGYCETGNKEGLEHTQPIHDVQTIPASEYGWELNSDAINHV